MAPADAPHPFVGLLVEALRHGTAERFVLAPEDLSRIGATIEAELTAAEARPGLLEVLTFAHYLETKANSPTAAGALIALVNGFGPKLATLGLRLEAVLEDAEQRQRQAAALLGGRPRGVVKENPKPGTNTVLTWFKLRSGK